MNLNCGRHRRMRSVSPNWDIWRKQASKRTKRLEMRAIGAKQRKNILFAMLWHNWTTTSGQLNTYVAHYKNSGDKKNHSVGERDYAVFPPLFFNHVLPCIATVRVHLLRIWGMSNRLFILRGGSGMGGLRVSMARRCTCLEISIQISISTLRM